MIILASFTAGYWGDIQGLLLRWNSGDDNYCYLIIPLFIYLCWDKRKDFRFPEFSWSPWGIPLTCLAMGMIVLGQRGAAETLVYLGLWGCLIGIAVSLYGARVRHLLFPLLILLFIVPFPPFLNRLLTFKLKMTASTLAVDMLNAIGVSVVQEGNIIDLGIDKLQVADACSGLRYFMPLILMGLLVGHFFSSSSLRKVLILVVTVPLAVFINGLRIFISGILTIGGRPELVQNLFHDFSGWVMFMIAGAVLIVFAFVLGRIGPTPSSAHWNDPGGTPVHPRTPFILALALCALFLIGGIAQGKAPSAKHMPPRRTFAVFPLRIGAWEGTRSYLAQEILASLWADDYLSATFHKADTPNAINVLIPFYAFQGTRHTAHAPQSCLLGSGWSLVSSARSAVRISDGRDIPVMLMDLAKGRQKILGSYFFLQRGRVIVNPWMNKVYLLWDALTRGRTDGALVRVELLLADGQSPAEARQELIAFIGRLWPLLSAYVPD